ncbi:MAG: type VI secretion system Vgr family protein [Geminicoccaceae bacterium]
MADREVTVKPEAGGADLFLFQRLAGQEELGRLYRFRLTLLSERADLVLEDLLGKGMTVTALLEAGQKRHFHGLVSYAAFVGQEGVYGRYEVELVPWLWFLGRGRDCRIFQHKSVPEIVQAVFEGWSVADFELKLDESYAARDYTVQYRESDLDFVCRLLEDEGIYFFHRHRDGGHTLVLADGEGAHEAGPGYERLPFFPPDQTARRERDHVFAWLAQADVRPGTATLRDFDFEKPRADLTGTDAEPKPHALATAEVYDYPGGYHELALGDRRARVRLEELQVDHVRAKGEASAGGIACGNRFELERHPRQDQNRSYLVVAAGYDIQSEGYRSAADTGREQFLCSFEVQELRVPYRPPRTTPRPYVGGLQTATVTGPAGEEIYTDKYGRVKVQFHWDRQGKRDQDSSCWVRVSQLWAGASWGGIHIPRIGQEVIVDFLEGDPDQPIITGRVYNALAMPPYGLPANATQSGIKSNSSKGGGGSNELRFEDKKGAEQVWLHAQKNEDIVVENDKTEKVGHDETISIGNDRGETVGHDETMAVGNNRTRTVGVNETVTVGSNQTVTVGGMRADTVALAEVRTVGAAQQQLVGAARNVTVGANQAHEVGMSDGWAIGANRSVSIGKDDSLSIQNNRSVRIGTDDSLHVDGKRGVEIGDDSTTRVGGDETDEVSCGLQIKVGKVFMLNAGDQVTLVVGDASISMKKNGDIAVSGKNISIEASGKITLKASGQIVQSGSKISQN